MVVVVLVVLVVAVVNVVFLTTGKTTNMPADKINREWDEL